MCRIRWGVLPASQSFSRGHLDMELLTLGIHFVASPAHPPALVVPNRPLGGTRAAAARGLDSLLATEVFGGAAEAILGAAYVERAFVCLGPLGVGSISSCYSCTLYAWAGTPDTHLHSPSGIAVRLTITVGDTALSAELRPQSTDPRVGAATKLAWPVSTASVVLANTLLAPED